MTLNSEVSPKVTKAQADSAYAKGDFALAIELYENILSAQGESSDIYYNLGNSYYKSKDIARAILNYERAYLLNPGDSDIRFNLELASRELVDVISIRPGRVMCRRPGREAEPLSLDDARVRRQFFSRLEQKLKLKNPEFWFRLMNRQLDGETAKLAPAGFWRNNFRVFAEAAK